MENDPAAPLKCSTQAPISLFANPMNKNIRMKNTPFSDARELPEFSCKLNSKGRFFAVSNVLLLNIRGSVFQLVNASMLQPSFHGAEPPDHRTTANMFISYSS